MQGKTSLLKLIVGARSSPLALVQVDEVLTELRRHHPEIAFEGLYFVSQGDKDQTTSLRTLGKTDFFTKEIDALLLAGECRLAVHSAID